MVIKNIKYMNNACYSEKKYHNAKKAQMIFSFIIYILCLIVLGVKCDLEIYS